MRFFGPNMIAAAAYHLAGKLSRRESEWDATLAFQSGRYTVPMLPRCDPALHRLPEVQSSQDSLNGLTAATRKLCPPECFNISVLLNNLLPELRL